MFCERQWRSGKKLEKLDELENLKKMKKKWEKWKNWKFLERRKNLGRVEKWKKRKT